MAVLSKCCALPNFTHCILHDNKIRYLWVNEEKNKVLSNSFLHFNLICKACKKIVVNL